MIVKHEKLGGRTLDRVGFKDASVKFIKARYPKILDNISDVIEFAESKKSREFKFMTIDVFSKKYFLGERTCVDTGWHVDGKDTDNEYFLVCFGQNRTIFQEIGEVEEGVVYRYDSTDVHKGRDCEVVGYRLFVRVCFSDSISAKNKVFF